MLQSNFYHYSIFQPLILRYYFSLVIKYEFIPKEPKNLKHDLLNLFLLTDPILFKVPPYPVIVQTFPILFIEYLTYLNADQTFPQIILL